MSAQHTPGPWEVTGFSDCQLITKDVPPMIGQPIAIGKVYSPSAVADARLIAAAPELLAALEGAIGALEQDVDTGADYSDSDWTGIANQRLAAARAAIAKARGQA